VYEKKREQKGMREKTKKGKLMNSIGGENMSNNE
jgi:hypothetical protein